MDGDFIKELATRLRQPMQLGNVIVKPNDWTADDPAALVKPGPQASTLKVSTLGALVDYIRANRDVLDLSTLIIHVVGATRVDLSGRLDARTRVRETFVSASTSNLVSEETTFLGRYMDLEDFLIGLQTRFVRLGTIEALLKLLSNVKGEQVRQALDDGLSQTVTAKAGVALVADVSVPNPVFLAPYRTFREVTQPISPFILRLRSGKTLPEVALFEADAGAWRLEAMTNIANWIRAHDLSVGILS